MKFRRLLLTSALGLGFLAVTPSEAKADPVSAFIITTLGFTATASAVAATTTFLINAGLAIATNIATRVMSRQKAGNQERQASVATLSLGEGPREAVLGETVTAGWLIDAFNFGGQYGTDTVTRCIGLADHAIDSIVGFYVGEKYYPWTGSGPQAAFSNKLSFHFRPASGLGYDPPEHVRVNGGWTNQDRLASITHIWVDTQGDDKVWTQGHPQFRFVLRGLKAYDPRKDAALGYTGPNPHVWEDRATHEFTRNAAVLRYAFQRGIYAEAHQGDPDYLLIGRGLTAEEAPPERVIACANICDETVNGAPRYRADGVIRAADDFIQVEEFFAAAMAGVIIQHEGGVEVEPGHAKAAVLTITDGDLVVGEPVQFSDFLPDTDGGRINSIVPSFTDPAQNWTVRSGPVRRDVADIQADGGPRELTLPLTLVTSANQADRCAEITRRLARLERRASIVLPPEYAGLEEGDWIAWGSDRYHDGQIVRYRIESWSLDAAWRMRLQLREVSATAYGAAAPLPDLIAPPGSPFAPGPLQLGGVAVEPIELPDDPETEGGTSTVSLPALKFSWDIPVDPAVIAIRAEVRRAGSVDVATSRTEEVNRPGQDTPLRGSLIVTNGVPPGAAIEARLMPITSATREVFDAPWLAVTTTNLVTLSSEDTAALDRLARIESDNWLTPNEKAYVLGQYEAASAEYPGIATRLNTAGLATQLTAFNAAINALQDYVSDLDPSLYDFTQDTPIIGGDLRAVFTDYYEAKQAGIDALLADARTRAINAAADADTALDSIEVIVSDNWLSKGEKPGVIQQWNVILGETNALRDQAAAFGATAQRTAYIAAYDALLAYLTGLTPSWSDLNTDTPIVGATFRARFSDYYLRRQEMLTAQMGITDAESSEALARLAIIDADGWLSKGEKPQVMREWEAINAEHPTLRDQADAVGAAVQRDALITAKNALDSYLAGLTPAWNDPLTDTPIVPATFRARFLAWYTARQNALTAISNAVGADGAEALDRLAIIDSDNWLSRGEKPEVIRIAGFFNTEFPGLSTQGLALGLTTQVNALGTAIQALNTYLDGLTPDYDDTATDTPIVGSTFRAKFNDAFLAKTALQNAMVGAVDSDVSLAISRLDIIASDSWLSVSEKPQVIRDWDVIINETNPLRDQAAAVGVTTARTAYIAAYDALLAYLNSLSPSWNSLAADTPIVGATFRQKFVDYYVARQALRNAIDARLSAEIDGLIDIVDVIASDNWLSAGEKPQIVREVSVITGESGGLDTQAGALGITTERSAYSTAFNDLVSTYLPSLSPAWDSLTTDTPIVGATFRSKFVTYYVARQALQNAIAAKLDADIGTLETDLGVITSDNWLSRNEKPAIIREHATLNGDYTGLTTRANNLGVTTELTAHGNAIANLNSYLSGLSPAWNTLTVDTPMNGATLRSRLETAYSTRQTLLNAFTAVLDANADAALSDLAIIAADNWLSRVEKPSIIQQWQTIVEETGGLRDQAQTLGITTARTAYITACDTLAGYLSGLSPAWDNIAVDTPISGSTLRTRFQNVYTTKTALQNAMVAVGGAGAFQASVSPPNRNVFVANGSGNFNMGSFSISTQNAPGAVTYTWTHVFGSQIFSANSPTSATTNVTATGAQVGQVYEAIFEWSATSGGQTRRGNAYVTLTTESNN